MSSYHLTHLKLLEAESIHIIREVAAEFHNPVMLYSIGKDSSVMVQLAMKAFYPDKPPFPLLHVDTTWKFREMIEFRENYARRELGLDLIVYINEQGRQLGIQPLDDSEKHTEIMKTDALKQALTKYQFDAAFGGAAGMRRNHAPRNASTPFATGITRGIPRTNARNCGICITPR